MDLLTKILINKYKNQGGGSGGAKINLFVQDSEPSDLNGIWIKSESFTYDNIEEIANENSKVASSINIVKGDRIETIMYNDVENELHYNFNEVLLTDSNNEIIYDINVYYGNGSEWVDITPVPQHIVGLSADFVNNVFTRLEDSANWTAGSDFNVVKCYQRRRCNITDNGIITAYYGDSNYTETGFTQNNITIGDTTIPAGTQVQVMVEQPKVWYKVEPVELNGNKMLKANYYVADKQVAGFKVHPAFIKNGVECDKIYLSAFEGTVYSVSNNQFIGGTSRTLDFNKDKLSSVKGTNLKPKTYLERSSFRALANNRGSNWSMLTIQAQSLEQLLLIIEYAGFNMQNLLSYGVSDGSTQADIGSVTSLNSSGTGLAGESISSNNAFTWRYAENIYANTWKMIDGINFDTNLAYVSDHNFADEVFSGAYSNTGITAVVSSVDYISRFGYSQDYDWLFIPVEANGTIELPVGDYIHSNTNTGATGLYLGGGVGLTTKSGAFCFRNDVISSAYNNGTGSRLFFTPIP